MTNNRNSKENNDYLEKTLLCIFDLFIEDNLRGYFLIKNRHDFFQKSLLLINNELEIYYH